MLWVSGKLEVEGCSLMTHFGFERALRLFAIQRHGFVWETRFSPPHRSPGPGLPIVYLVLDGCVSWHRPARPDEGPGSAFLTCERDLAGGEPARALRASGEPYRALQLFVAPEHVIGGVPAEPRSLPMNERILGASQRVFAELGVSSTATESTRELVRELVEAAVLRPAVIGTVRSEEPAQFARCWRGVAKHYMPMEAAPSLQDLAQATGVSLRQFTRDVAALLETFLIGGDGFRHVASDARLRCALLLLSAPALTIAGVARTAGYGSAQALGRAFRDAGLPAPSAIRKELEAG